MVTSETQMNIAWETKQINITPISSSREKRGRKYQLKVGNRYGYRRSEGSSGEASDRDTFEMGGVVHGVVK